MGLFNFSRRKSTSPSSHVPERSITSRLSVGGVTPSRSISRSLVRSPSLNTPLSSNAQTLQSSLEPLDAPPPYAPQETGSRAYAGASLTATSDSPYAFLSQFDTLFLIDDSGSMAGRSWRETAAALAAVAPICTSHDADGIDIYFLNHRNPADSSGAYTKISTPSHVHEIFTMVSPRGGTPTGTRLNHILQPYLKRLETAAMLNPLANLDTVIRPLNIIVITDGVPSDDVESVIVNAARKLDKLNAQPWQVGIQFFQVGNEPDAAEELRELDDALAEAKGVRDIVDTVPFAGQNGVATSLTAAGVLKTVLGAIHRKYDRQNAK
ncbi:hypothetical protein VTO42DRAFT_9045 [Malbranchea cinnamomea]